MILLILDYNGSLELTLADLMSDQICGQHLYSSNGTPPGRGGNIKPHMCLYTMVSLQENHVDTQLRVWSASFFCFGIYFARRWRSTEATEGRGAARIVRRLSVSYVLRRHLGEQTRRLFGAVCI